MYKTLLFILSIWDEEMNAGVKEAPPCLHEWRVTKNDFFALQL
jgi:hypothetical protein